MAKTNTCMDFQEVNYDFRCVDENHFVVDNKDKYFVVFKDRDEFLLRVSKIAFVQQNKQYQIELHSEQIINGRYYTLLKKPFEMKFFHQFNPQSYVQEIQVVLQLYKTSQNLSGKGLYKVQLISQNILVDQESLQIKFISLGEYEQNNDEDEIQFYKNLHLQQLKKLQSNFKNNQQVVQANTLQYLKIKTIYIKYMQELSQEIYDSSFVDDLNLLSEKFAIATKKDPQKIQQENKIRNFNSELKFLVLVAISTFVVLCVYLVTYMLRKKEQENYNKEKFYEQKMNEDDSSMTIPNYQ